MRNLALLDVCGRAACRLIDLTRPIDQYLVIDQKLTQQNIANMLGVSRETVSHIALFEKLSRGR